MKSIALFLIALLFVAPALAAPPPGRYCAHQSMERVNLPGGAIGGSEIPALDIVVEVQDRQGASWVSFHDAVANGPEALAAGPVAGTVMPGGAISFSFKDAHGGSGDGVLTQSGALSLRRSPGLPGGDSGLDKTYGTFRVNAAACTDADKALVLSR